MSRITILNAAIFDEGEFLLRRYSPRVQLAEGAI